MRTTTALLCTIASAVTWGAFVVNAFQVKVPSALSTIAFRSHPAKTCSLLYESKEEGSTSDADKNVESFLKAQYPRFYSLLSKNPEVWKAVNESKTGSTFFAPSAEVFESLGDKKQQQMKDERNLEQVEKLGAYHVIAGEAVGEEILLMEDWTKPKPKDGSPRPLKIGGIMTLGGEVPVGRSKSGGFLGIGAKEDGKIVVGPNARITKSFVIGKDLVHEVDDLISPAILWRYFDQLRIPGI